MNRRHLIQSLSLIAVSGLSQSCHMFDRKSELEVAKLKTPDLGNDPAMTKLLSQQKSQIETNRFILNELGSTPFPLAQYYVQYTFSNSQSYSLGHLLEKMLEEEIVREFNLALKQINFFVGSREAIRLCVLSPRIKKIFVSWAEYQEAEEAAQEVGKKLEKILLSKSLKHDLSRFYEIPDLEGNLIYLSNPHLPFGGFLSVSEIEKLISARPKSLFVIDEAYIHFTGIDFKNRSVTTLINKNPNLIVLQTFSKAYGMASLRLGVAMGQEETLLRQFGLREGLVRRCSSATLAAGLGSILSTAELTKVIQRNLDLVQFCQKKSDSLGLKMLETHGNFINISVPEKKSSRDYWENLFIPSRIHVSVTKKEAFVRLSLKSQDLAEKFFAIIETGLKS